MLIMSTQHPAVSHSEGSADPGPGSYHLTLRLLQICMSACAIRPLQPILSACAHAHPTCRTRSNRAHQPVHHALQLSISFFSLFYCRGLLQPSRFHCKPFLLAQSKHTIRNSNKSSSNIRNSQRSTKGNATVCGSIYLKDN